MKPRIYLETTIVSLLASRPARDPINASRQHFSQALWSKRTKVQFVISDIVKNEIARGDPAQAKNRLELVAGLTNLELSDEAVYLAKLLVERKALPVFAYADALHIALATVHNVLAIASYNFRHLSGAFARRKIETTLAQLGYSCPAIVLPEEIWESL
jgi:predicted nucleic acid-binding protein